ncbi:MAG TPA: LuxR C-terminal-related transcriptional regulator, partial [Streptosporangiaceae bacterium]|nr:LuxR C-terminal-related transcriptional regulator [Streptosporangiaceae bacterium]
HVIGALSDSSAAGLLGQLRTPSLVLHRADEFIPVAEAHQLAALIPGAQLEILPGADHQPWAGDTDAVVERIAVFLDRIRPGPRPAGAGPSRATRPLTGWASLTGAEARVAALAADGYSNPAIARELFLSRGTVETHLKRVYAKLAIDGRHQLHLIRPPAGPG